MNLARHDNSMQSPSRLAPEIILLVLAGLVLALAVPVFSAPVAHAVYCTNCYGSARWPGTITGGSSEFKTVGLFSVNDGVNHISEEIWLFDTAHPCNSNSLASWAAVGEATQVGSTGNWYFWEDCRPGQIARYNFILQPPGGDVGQYFQYFINQTATGTYTIQRYDSAGSLRNTWTSGSNTMTPNNIRIGVETSNNSYSVTHADPDYFIYNQWRNGGGWNFQTNPGQSVVPNDVYNPPNWTWLTAPAPAGNGGYGKSTCC